MHEVMRFILPVLRIYCTNLLSIPCVYAAAHAFFLLMADYGVMLTGTYVEVKSYVISILLTAGCYFGTLWLLCGIAERAIEIGLTTQEAVRRKRKRFMVLTARLLSFFSSVCH